MPRDARGKKPAAPVEEDGWISVREAARMLGMTRFRFLTFAMRNGIASQIVAGRTVVSRESVERLSRDMQRAS